MNADRPLVSVILPVYNGMPFLPQAVDSIRSQTCADWELVAVNDGSTDDSGDYLRLAAAADQRLRVVEHPVNRGVAAAYNTGLTTARGRYVAFQEQDDISLPARLERQIEAMRRHNAPIVSARVGQLDAGDVLYGYWPLDVREDVEINPPGYRLNHRILVFHTNIANATMMLDREGLEPGDLVFDEEFRRCCQDADFQMRLVLRYPSVRLREVLVHMHRFKELGSATSDAAAMVPDMRRLLRKHGRTLRTTAPPLAALRSWSRAWSNELLFEARFQRGNWRGWGLGMLSLMLWPANPEAWRALRNRVRPVSGPPGGARNGPDPGRGPSHP